MRPASEKCPHDDARVIESAGFPISAPAPHRILLADDSADIRALVAAYLEHTPHYLEVAADGQTAVEKFCAGHFDLVLMDVQMPVMDGFTAAGAIRRWEAKRGVRRAIILALTGGAADEDALASLEPVCDALLNKPFRMQAFLQAIEDHLKLSGVIRVSLSPGIERLVPKYLDDRKSELSVLESALMAGDFDTIRVLGHQLKGSGTPYGFTALSQIGKSLELAGESQSPGEVRRQMSALGDYLARVKVMV